MEIIGHKKQQNFLNKIISSGETPHALLFSGPEKLGKKTIAFKMVSSLLGEDLSQHPDFTLIEPKENTIQIEQIRNLNWRLSLKPIKSSILGVVIDDAHSMTREAQNCFLKTLEEPKSKSILVLIVKHPNFLLPTIVSRCENIKFYPVKKEEIKNYLVKKKFQGQDIEQVVEISSGRPGMVVDILENPEMLKERKEKINKLIRILSSPLSLRFEYVKDLSQKQDLMEILTIWLSYFRQKLIFHKNQADLKKIRNILNNIQETIFLISTTNVNPRLALEVLVMKF
jgi:DNA polymerase-3 subunit delta'